MKLISLPDLHERVDVLADIARELSAADLVLLVGDLTNAGYGERAAQVIYAVQRYNPRVLAVAGNWDRPPVDAYLNRAGIGLHRTAKRIGGVTFIGVSAALYAPVRTPNEFGEDDFQRFLTQAAAGIDRTLPVILVCHQPPAQTRVDQTASGRHIGSDAIRAFIETEQPLLCFTGHAHGGGIDSIGSTQIINPGPLWEGGYAYADIEDGEIRALEIRQR